jgi:hypothetical protein
MSNYKESTVAGTAYVRSNSVVIANPVEGVRAISYYEEQVINLEGGERIIRPKGGLQEPFTTENMLSEFPLVNPETGAPVGVTMKYLDVYVALHSLYLYLAQKRDEAIAVVAPVEPDPV